MTGRAARAAEQNDPHQNVNFRRRWVEAVTTGDYPGRIAAWHSPDLPTPTMSWRRLQAEAAWARVAGKVAP